MTKITMVKFGIQRLSLKLHLPSTKAQILHTTRTSNKEVRHSICNFFWIFFIDDTLFLSTMGWGCFQWKRSSRMIDFSFTAAARGQTRVQSVILNLLLLFCKVQGFLLDCTNWVKARFLEDHLVGELLGAEWEGHLKVSLHVVYTLDEGQELAVDRLLVLLAFFWDGILLGRDGRKEMGMVH